MIKYIYFIKCPSCPECHDEHFELFDEAKARAMSFLSYKPTITQVETNRNDFDECTDSCDLGTVWSWEDCMADEEPACSTFTKDYCRGNYDPDCDSEFTTLDNTIAYAPDNFHKPITESANIHGMAFWAAEYLGDLYKMFNTGTPKAGSAAYNKKCRDAYKRTKERWNIDDDDEIEDILTRGYGLWKHYYREDACKPIPDDMTIEQLVEAMEENEDTVECKKCNELFSKDNCAKDPELGWVCEGCSSTITESKKNELDHFGTYYFEPSDDFDMLLEYRNLPFEWEDEKVYDGISMYEPNVVVHSNDEVLPYYYFKISVKDLLTWLRDVAHEPEADSLDEESLIGAGFNADSYDFFEALLKKHKVALFSYYYDWAVEQLTEGIANGDEHVLHQVESYMQELDERYTESVDIQSRKVIYEDTHTASWNSKPVELEYLNLTVTLQGPMRDADDWDEEETFVPYYTYEADPNSVAEVLCDLMTDDDVTDVPGGFDALEDEAVFNDFMNRNFEYLVEKYMDQLCAHFEEYAREEYEEGHGLYESNTSKKEPLEVLEEFDNDAHLTTCPECNSVRFDTEIGICLDCGFNVNA